MAKPFWCRRHTIFLRQPVCPQDVALFGAAGSRFPPVDPQRLSLHAGSVYLTVPRCSASLHNGEFSWRAAQFDASATKRSPVAVGGRYPLAGARHQDLEAMGGRFRRAAVLRSGLCCAVLLTHLGAIRLFLAENRWFASPPLLGFECDGDVNCRRGRGREVVAGLNPVQSRCCDGEKKSRGRRSVALLLMKVNSVVFRAGLADSRFPRVRADKSSAPSAFSVSDHLKRR